MTADAAGTLRARTTHTQEAEYVKRLATSLRDVAAKQCAQAERQVVRAQEMQVANEERRARLRRVLEEGRPNA